MRYFIIKDKRGNYESVPEDWWECGYGARKDVVAICPNKDKADEVVESFNEKIN